MNNVMNNTTPIETFKLQFNNATVDLSGCSIQQLKEFAQSIVDACELQEQLDKPVEARPEFTGEVYFMPVMHEVFTPGKIFSDTAARLGKPFGIEFVEGEAIVEVVVADPGDDQTSWGNGDVPVELAKILDPEDGNVRFPAYIPLQLAEKIANFDGVQLRLDKASINLKPLEKQGLHYDKSAREVLDDIIARTAQIRKTGKLF